MANARYSIGLSKLKKAFFGSGLDKLKAGYMYENGAYVKVWSGATRVSYYDGETLLGTENVEEGEDVLHPSFSTSKENYTLYGWATESGTETREETLTASGDTMTLYAIYLPNTLTVYQAHLSGGSYVVDSKNDNYVSGTFQLNLNASYGENSGRAYFDLLKGHYNTATVTAYAEFDRHDSGGLSAGYAEYDNSYILSGYNPSGSSGSKNFTSAEGRHSLYVWVKSYSTYFQNGYACITKILLSNPVAWE